MKSTKIILEWTENGKKSQKQLERKEIKEVFKGLSMGFRDDNEISKRMLKIIPEVDKIFIYKDVNRSQDDPFIIYCIDGEEDILKIKRYHKIVWAIFDKYCTE